MGEEKKVKFKVGDKVRVRERDVMVAEFGVYSDGDIKTPNFLFASCKKHCCGFETIVLAVDSKNGSCRTGNATDGYWFPKESLELIEEETTQEEFKEGEIVEVSDYDSSREKRIYICTIPGKVVNKYVCVSNSNEDEYNSGEKYHITYRKNIRKIQPKKTILTKQEIAEKLGLKLEDLEITE